ncbi:MAG: GNAT family N-acetyltransferase [Ktedonobacteraceae bacterium]
MNASIIQVKTTKDNPEVSQLFGEYAQWFSTMFKQIYGVNIEVKDIQEKLLQFDEFMPPRGSLLLCYANEALAGIACMRDIGMETGEIKRMYVRPSFRQMGLGRALLNRLIDEANVIGYRCLRLDSARFMTEAHQLYRSFGFGEIAPYEGSEIVSEFPKEFHSAWIYMEKSLA